MWEEQKLPSRCVYNRPHLMFTSTKRESVILHDDVVYKDLSAGHKTTENIFFNY